MPSFTIDNVMQYSFHDCYRHYLPRNALFEDQIIFSNGNLRFLFSYSLIAALLACASNIWLYIIEYIDIHHRTLYENDRLYYLYAFTRNTMSSLLPLIFIQKFLILRHHSSPKMSSHCYKNLI